MTVWATCSFGSPASPQTIVATPGRSVPSVPKPSSVGRQKAIRRCCMPRPMSSTGKWVIPQRSLPPPGARWTTRLAECAGGNQTR